MVWTVRDLSRSSHRQRPHGFSTTMISLSREGLQALWLMFRRESFPGKHGGFSRKAKTTGLIPVFRCSPCIHAGRGRQWLLAWSLFSGVSMYSPSASTNNDDRHCENGDWPPQHQQQIPPGHAVVFVLLDRYRETFLSGLRFAQLLNQFRLFRYGK